jgi:glycosyltransferase involved in cell wall biosynthesis
MTKPGRTDDKGSAPACCAIIPAYFEAGRIGPVVRDTLRYCPDVLVVDDGPDDATAEEGAGAGARVLRHDVNKGKGEALATAFRDAMQRGFDVVITLDADGQHDPAEIPAFLAAFARGDGEVLVGNRMADTRDMPLVRRMTNRFMSWLLSREMGQVVPDTQCGYRLYARRVLPLMPTVSPGFAAESEQLLYLADRGVTIGSVPIKTIYGDEKSKIRPVRDTILFFRMLRRHRRGGGTTR